MRKPNARNAISVAVAGVLLLSSVAGAGVVGVITATSKHGLTVAGTDYAVGSDVALEDMAGQPITFPELRPGVSVELELDEEGRLTRVRAAVVR